MRCAMVRNNLVMGILELDEVGYQEFSHFCEALIDITDMNPVPQVGWIFDGNHLLMSDGSTPIDWRITRLSMRNRFSVSELLAIMTAANTNSMVKLIMDNNNVAEYVDLSTSATQSAVGYFASIGLITSDRMGQILMTPPRSDELAFGGL